MRSWSKWVIFSRRTKSSRSVGPRAPTFSDCWLSLMRPPWLVVSAWPSSLTRSALRSCCLLRSFMDCTSSVACTRRRGCRLVGTAVVQDPYPHAAKKRHANQLTREHLTLGVSHGLLPQLATGYSAPGSSCPAAGRLHALQSSFTPTGIVHKL